VTAPSVPPSEASAVYFLTMLLDYLLDGHDPETFHARVREIRTVHERVRATALVIPENDIARARVWRELWRDAVYFERRRADASAARVQRLERHSDAALRRWIRFAPRGV